MSAAIAEPVQATRFQIRWWDRRTFGRTIFVAEGAFSDDESFVAWKNQVIGSRKREMPAGWMPLVCQEGSRYFVPQQEQP